MTRPEMVRADTLDLQDPTSPSAKDHTRQPASPKPLGDGPPAPHQAQSLRKASLDGYDLNVRSPRGSKDLSDKELQLLHDADGEDHDGMGDGGHDIDGEDMGIDDDDDDLDDDMMDKISSSPSIDDGVYQAQPAWPRRGDSLLHRYSRKTIVERTSEPSSKAVAELFPVDNRHVVSASTKRYNQSASVSPRKSVQECQRTETSEIAARSTRSSLFKENFKTIPGTIHEEEELSPLTKDEPDDFIAKSEAHLSDEGYSSEVDDRPGSLELDSDSEHSSVDTLSDDDDDDPELWEDERFIDSGWGGECLRETEDIDFEFVYALHTFVATVEGQANATKGDTMVLLDDSNSYWWLVKVVKDSSIGYLPAEHIETPTERLARLNKHRNIDLSQTMLGDNPEKSRNPLKIAMRRRNAKTVQFTDPIYYEPSEPSYSSDEEEDELMAPMALQTQAQAQSQTRAHDEQQVEDEPAAVEPLRPSRANANEDGSKKSLDSEVTQVAESDRPRSSQDTIDSRDEEGTGRRRMRNTDSFYKDESVETIKKSLTPNILRDESSAAAVEDSRASLDSQKSNEKAAAKDEKPKKEKKEKKGMLGGLFKRKNSKSKHEKEDEKEDLATLASPKASSDSTSHDSLSAAASAGSQVQKQGKLQKTQKSSSGSKRGKDTEDKLQATKQEAVVADVQRPDTNSRDLATEAPERRGAPAPLRLVPSDEKTAASTSDPKSPGASKGGLFSPIEKVQTMLHSGSASKPVETKPEKVKKAKNRMALEDSDMSEDDASAVTASTRQQPDSTVAPLRPAPQPLETNVTAKPERLSESPIEVSPVASTNYLAPGHTGSSLLDVPPSPVSAVSTPELVERPSESDVTRSAPAPVNATKPSPSLSTQRAVPPTTTKTPDINATPSTSTMSSPVTAPTTPQWSPAALRTYIETNGANDVRDLILLVHDTSDVKSLPQHHDVVRGFDGETKKLDGMQKRLDNLLDEVLKRNALPMSVI